MPLEEKQWSPRALIELLDALGVKKIELKGIDKYSQ
jgi:hypothetical protein